MKKLICKLLGVMMITASITSCIYDRNELSAKENSIKQIGRTSILISGSTTVSPLMDKLTSDFSDKITNPEVILSATGSSEGFKSLLNDSSDIAMASSKISPALSTEFRKKNKHFVEYILAGDALVFAVNINNPVKKLTVNQIEDIFNGKITNWKQLGGEDMAIKVISRDHKSGTYKFFMEDVLKHSTMSKTATVLHTNEEVIDAITNDKAAIGYTNFSMIDYSIDPISISFDNTKTNYVAPRAETVSNMTYKYYRGLYLYYNPEKYQKIKPLMDMIQTDRTMHVIAKTGYIPVNQKLIMK